jgi:hypothetical protein
MGVKMSETETIPITLMVGALEVRLAAPVSLQAELVRQVETEVRLESIDLTEKE